MIINSCLDFAGLEANFNQWDPLIDGQDENLIPGTNVTVLQSSIWTAPCCRNLPVTVWPSAAWFHLMHGTQWNGPRMWSQGQLALQDIIFGVLIDRR